MSAFDTDGKEMMTSSSIARATITALDGEHTTLVRLAAAVAGAGEQVVRKELSAAAEFVRGEWVEEVILQSYLFAGFPRALNAMREWRRISGRAAPTSDDSEDFANALAWRARGEQTCSVVYGKFYEPLRHNIRELHPALDAWMIVEGYGKVLGRPQLALWQRELCVVAACAAAHQERQLHSHLHGALHAGASIGIVRETLQAIADLVGPEETTAFLALLEKVANHHVH